MSAVGADRPGPPAAVPDLAVGPVPVPGRPQQLAPGLLRLTAPNPGMMTGPGTNTYLVGEGPLAVVDPGPDDEGHRSALLAAVAAAGTSIGWVLVTHTHPDHAPGAAALAAATGAEVVGFDARDGFEPDRAVGDGWLLEAPGLTLRAVHTPGHASNHLCWLHAGSGVLLTGDHVMEGSTVVIRPPDGDMAAYLASLARVGQVGAELLGPGHGRLLRHPRAVAAGIVAHRLGREAVVAAALARAGRANVDGLLGDVYPEVAERLLPVARFSLWAHLRHLAEAGRAACDRPIDTVGGDLEATWWPLEGAP